VREFWRLPVSLAAAVAVFVVGALVLYEGRRPSEPDVDVAAPGVRSVPGESATPVAPREEGRSVDDARLSERREMVETQLRGRDITDERVLAAMLRVPRHVFVPAELQDDAYVDGPLPIGHGQTISQPYIVALMTQLVRPKPADRALDVGTGSGYQAAVLAELVHEVYGIEIVCPLAEEASERLTALGYRNVTVRCGDGYQGWKEHAPFDIIVVAAAPDHVPRPLVEQLAPGGRLVIPVGDVDQELRLLEKQADGSIREIAVAPVRFVPMTGEARRRGAP
jgi:protein-L-isoaspartate(D-aspartate) O-methyltransferase